MVPSKNNKKVNSQDDENLMMGMLLMMYLNGSIRRHNLSRWSTCWDMDHEYVENYLGPVVMMTWPYFLNFMYVILFTIPNNTTLIISWKMKYFFNRWWFWLFSPKYYYYQRFEIKIQLQWRGNTAIIRSREVDMDSIFRGFHNFFQVSDNLQLFYKSGRNLLNF